MSLSGNTFINRFYTRDQVFGKASLRPPMMAGQSSIVVSDGNIPGTVDGNIYLIPFGQPPIDLTGSAGGEINTGNNSGTGTGTVFKDKSGSILNFRTLASGPGINITTSGDEITITNTEVTKILYEDISTSSASDPDSNIEVSDFNLNTASLINLNLSDPSPAVLGQKKKILVSRLTAGSSLNLNIISFANGSALLFTALGQSASLIWTAAGWAIDNSGADLIP